MPHVLSPRDQPAVKKPLPNINAKRVENADRAAAKRTGRSSRKTVLTIAQVDSRNEHCDASDEYLIEDASHEAANGSLPEQMQRLGIPSKTISPELATGFSCKLMAIALQRGSCLSANDKNASIQKLVENVLNGFEEAGDFTTGSGSVLQRLKSLLNQLHRDELEVQERTVSAIEDNPKQVLSNALHAVIASLCQGIQIDQAVETASKRAIYQFAYGLTHEINNPLANIVARAQQLIATASTDSDRRSLATIVDQAMRAHEMLAEMMRVVQPRSIQPRVEDIVAIVRQAVAIQEKQWTQRQIQCSLGVSTKPLYCSVEKASMTEAVCSILQNALQVCRPNDRIEIKCHRVESDNPDYGPSRLLSHADEESVPRVRIAVRDTGPGLSHEAIERAWDLYFSGREHGRGLGISLASVRRTMDAHGGFVWIQSNPNAGCTVEIRLPIVPDPPSPRKVFAI